MPTVDLRHTADLTAPERAAVRALLYAVFDDLDETDVEHALGGLHALVWEGDDLVAHAAVTDVVRGAYDVGGLEATDEAVSLDLTGEITADWRDGDVW